MSEREKLYDLADALVPANRALKDLHHAKPRLDANARGYLAEFITTECRTEVLAALVEQGPLTDEDLRALGGKEHRSIFDTFGERFGTVMWTFPREEQQ